MVTQISIKLRGKQNQCVQKQSEDLFQEHLKRKTAEEAVSLLHSSCASDSVKCESGAGEMVQRKQATERETGGQQSGSTEWTGSCES